MPPFARKVHFCVVTHSFPGSGRPRTARADLPSPHDVAGSQTHSGKKAEPRRRTQRGVAQLGLVPINSVLATSLLKP